MNGNERVRSTSDVWHVGLRVLHLLKVGVGVADARIDPRYRSRRLADRRGLATDDRRDRGDESHANEPE
jgi:hypothetical protein